MTGTLDDNSLGLDRSGEDPSWSVLLLLLLAPKGMEIAWGVLLLLLIMLTERTGDDVADELGLWAVVPVESISKFESSTAKDSCMPNTSENLE